MKRALITGITGQDGSYLAELLIEKGYEVFGLIRRASNVNTQRIAGLKELKLLYGDLSDSSCLHRIIRSVQPDEVYNLGAQSNVGTSFEIPEFTGDITGLGALRILEAIRDSKKDNMRFYQASSSELFGGLSSAPYSESSPFSPRSPYAAAKAYAFYITKNYREAYNLFAVNGILFNHESPRRGELFVTRKITLALARIKFGLQDKLFLGNLDAKRDWGFAKDFVQAMWLMMQHSVPKDFVIATGQSYSVRDFLDRAAKIVEIDWQKHVEIDPQQFRPLEVSHLQGDASLAQKELGWRPTVDFDSLVTMMMRSDLELVRRELGN